MSRNTKFPRVVFLTEAMVAEALDNLHSDDYVETVMYVRSDTITGPVHPGTFPDIYFAQVAAKAMDIIIDCMVGERRYRVYPNGNFQEVDNG